MNKIDVFHKAFENDISHVATMKMPINKNTDDTLEYIYKRTQNINDSWHKDSIGFYMIPKTDTRSTSCGDIIKMYNNEYYVVRGTGFTYIDEKTFKEISKLKDNQLAQYFFDCHKKKDIDLKAIKQTKIKITKVSE
tara:strand:- start:253 stop:660 length:408 start_codon:yes stop_codon:yes gene_type:complete